MEADDRLMAYARDNGQLERYKIRMTPRQRRRYWKKWFKHWYIQPVILDEKTGEEVPVLNDWQKKARLDREAPSPMWEDRPSVWSDRLVRRMGWLGGGWGPGEGPFSEISRVKVEARPEGMGTPREFEYPVG